jgi:hypothetical protein
VVVAEKKAVETTQNWNKFWYEVGLVMMEGTFEVQGRSLLYMQNTIMDGVETFKSHIEASQNWLQTANKPQEQIQQEAIPSLVGSSVDAYKRNVALWQRTLENGLSTLRGNIEVIRDMNQKVIKKVQEQQENLWFSFNP